MRTLILSALLLAAAILPASASTVLFSSTGPGRTAVDAALNPLPDGDLFLIGTFSNVGALTLSAGSAANVLASGGWSQFDGTRTISTIFGNPGKLTDQAQDNTVSANAFNLQNAYIVIFNSPSAATATEMGVFRATAGTPAWVFPTNAGGIGDSVTLDMNDTTIAAVNSVGSTTASPQRFVLTALVPEPSAIGLALSGVLGLVGYRRLRRLC